MTSSSTLPQVGILAHFDRSDSAPSDLAEKIGNVCLLPMRVLFGRSYRLNDGKLHAMPRMGIVSKLALGILSLVFFPVVGIVGLAGAVLITSSKTHQQARKIDKFFHSRFPASLAHEGVSKTGSGRDVNPAVVYAKAQQLAKSKRIYWIPHPRFTGEGAFAHNDACAVDVWRSKRFGHIFKEKRFEVLKRGTHNEFLRWLNEGLDAKKSASSAGACIGRFSSSKAVIFMNCADFVHFSLYSAGLISKRKILDVYQKHRLQELGALASQKFYGFHLKLFERLDLDKASKKVTPGDLIIGFNQHDQPVHIMFAGKDQTGLGLWCFPAYHAAQASLANLKAQSDDTEGQIHFKHCTLGKALAAL